MDSCGRDASQVLSFIHDVFLCVWYHVHYLLDEAYFKIMSPTTSRAFIAAGVVALTIGALSIPNVLQSFTTAVSSFFLLVLVLFISMWLFWVAGWTPRKQRIFTWLIAVCVGAFIVLFPFGFMRLLR